MQLPHNPAALLLGLCWLRWSGHGTAVLEGAQLCTSHTLTCLFTCVSIICLMKSTCHHVYGWLEQCPHSAAASSIAFTWQPCSELAVLGAQLSGFILCGSSCSMQGNVALYGWRHCVTLGYIMLRCVTLHAPPNKEWEGDPIQEQREARSCSCAGSMLWMACMHTAGAPGIMDLRWTVALKRLAVCFEP